MLEKRFIAVPPQSFTADGMVNGTLKIAHANLFKVKQQVILLSNSQPPLELEIKRIDDINTIEVGPKGPINNRQDISMYLVADGATIKANEQVRPLIPFEEVTRAVYEEEPIVATRVIPVDEMGAIRDDDNPVPIITGTDWDVADITRDGDDDIIEVEFSKAGVYVKDIELQYNGEKSVIKIIKSKA